MSISTHEHTTTKRNTPRCSTHAAQQAQGSPARQRQLQRRQQRWHSQWQRTQPQRRHHRRRTSEQRQRQHQQRHRQQRQRRRRQEQMRRQAQAAQMDPRPGAVPSNSHAPHGWSRMHASLHTMTHIKHGRRGHTKTKTNKTSHQPHQAHAQPQPNIASRRMNSTTTRTTATRKNR